MEYIDAPYATTKRFSNKRYSIRIDFCEHNMAVADIVYKKRNGMRKGNRNWAGDGWVSFDECKVESMYDYMDCMRRLEGDKVARRWFSREMKYCTRDYLAPDGRIDMKRTRHLENMIFHRSVTDIPRMDPCQLNCLRPLLQEVLCGGLRGTVRICSERFAIRYAQRALENPIAVRRINKRKVLQVVEPVGTLLDTIQALLPDFYQEMKKERRLDECDVLMQYCWNDEYPQLHICVEDSAYTVYTNNLVLE